MLFSMKATQPYLCVLGMHGWCVPLTMLHAP